MTKMTFTQVMKESRPESWQVLFAAFSASYGIGLLALLGLPFMFGATIDGLGLSEFEAGFLGTVEFLAIMLASIAIAPFMNIAPRRVIAIIGAIIAIVGNSFCVFWDGLDYQTLMVFRGVTGVGCGLTLAVGNATVSNARDPEKMTAHMSTLFIILMAITMLLFSWASADWGYKGVYAILGGCSLALTPFLLGLPQGLSAAAQAKAEQSSAARLFSLPSALVLGAMFVFALRDMSSWAFVERIGMGVGLPAQEIGQLLSLQAIVGIVGPLLAAIIGSRFGMSLPLAIGILASGAVYFIMLLVPESQAVYVTTAMFIGGTYFFALSYLTALAAQIDSTGRVVAASGGFLSAGIAFGPLVGGYLVETYGYQGTSGFILLMIFVTLAFALTGAKLSKKARRDAETRQHTRAENST